MVLKRILVTGAVSSVAAKTLNELPAVTISQALQGRVAGLQVTSNGSPGTEPIVRHKGYQLYQLCIRPAVCGRWRC